MAHLKDIMFYRASHIFTNPNKSAIKPFELVSNWKSKVKKTEAITGKACNCMRMVFLVFVFYVF